MIRQELINEGSMVDIAMMVAQTVGMIVAMGTPFALMIAHSLLTVHIKNAVTYEDMERINNAEDPLEESKKVLYDKGLKKGPLGIPVVDNDDPSAADRRRQHYPEDHPFNYPPPRR
jgi:hypothetical protein